MSSLTKTSLILFAMAALTVVPAVIHGRLTNRWGEPADMHAAAIRLDSFPQQAGDWEQLGEQETLPPEILRELQCTGYLNRRYGNRQTGDEVLVMVMVGSPGPLVRHPPEICYGNRANTMLGKPHLARIQAVDGQEHTLRVLRYRTPGDTGTEFSICYGWSAGGRWQVPEYPRLEFGSEPLLYKLQLLSSDDLPEGSEMPDAVSAFLHDFLPVLDRNVFAATDEE